MGEQHEQHKVVIGLGNPGKQYQLTRHNIGFLVVESLVRSNGWSFKDEKKFHAFVAKGGIRQGTLHVLMPTTYMNESGKAVRAYLDYYKLCPQDIIIVTDDVALPFGHTRVRTVGRSGGHNGLRSLEAYLNTTEYVRVRMGVDKNPPQIPLADYVLGSFNAEEQNKLLAFVEQGAAIVKRLITEDVAQVMNTVNTRLESKPADLAQRSGEEA